MTEHNRLSRRNKTITKETKYNAKETKELYQWCSFDPVFILWDESILPNINFYLVIGCWCTGIDQLYVSIAAFFTIICAVNDLMGWAFTACCMEFCNMRCWNFPFIFMSILLRCTGLIIMLHMKQSFPYVSEVTVGGDKVNMLTHTYPHKPLRKIRWPSAITGLTAHFVCPDVWSGDFASMSMRMRMSMVIHDTKCPLILRLGVTKQHKREVSYDTFLKYKSFFS